MKNLIQNICTLAQSKLSEKKGASEFVAVAILIIIVLVLAVVIFFPQISTWFQDVFMSGVTEKTNELFDFS